MIVCLERIKIIKTADYMIMIDDVFELEISSYFIGKFISIEIVYGREIIQSCVNNHSPQLYRYLTSSMSYGLILSLWPISGSGLRFGVICEKE